MFDDRELSGMQGLDDSARGMKPKVQIDRRAEEVVDVDDVGADVERNQCQPVQCQYPPELTHDAIELSRLEVHDGIERHDPDQARRAQAERPHVTHPELETRMETRGAADHRGRYINPDDRHSPIVKVFRDVPGAAADVGDESPTACCLGEPIQEMPVERFLGQLRGEMCGIGFGGRVVTVTDIHNPAGAPRLLRFFFSFFLAGAYFFAGALFFFAGAADFGRAWRGS
jgi:hypothetical protein